MIIRLTEEHDVVAPEVLPFEIGNALTAMMRRNALYEKNCPKNRHSSYGVNIMKVYTYSEARQRFAEVLNIARKEEVIIKRRSGETFTIVFKKTPKSPFDIPGIKTKATTKDILEAIKDSRERISEHDAPVDS